MKSLNSFAWPALNVDRSFKAELGTEYFRPGAELRVKFSVGVHSIFSVTSLKINGPNSLGVC